MRQHKKSSTLVIRVVDAMLVSVQEERFVSNVEGDRTRHSPSLF